MDKPEKSSEKYAALKEQGGTPSDVFKACKADGHKNWECQILLMGLFDMTLDQTRSISHAQHAENQESSPAIDYVEVDREAHQLLQSHGQNAYLYAARLAEKAANDGEREAEQFWRAVYASIRPR